MNYSNTFNKLFQRAKSKCYVVEYNVDAKCVDKSRQCLICAGTGNVITSVKMKEAFIDRSIVDQGLPNVNKNNTFGNYYADARIAYFTKDCNFDLSSNISRMVLSIVNGKIMDIFDVQYLEPVVLSNDIVHYRAALSAVNFNSTEQKKVFENIVRKWVVR